MLLLSLMSSNNSVNLSEAPIIRPVCSPQYFECYTQSQIQDFPKEGARFRVKCHVDAIQWGGK